MSSLVTASRSRGSYQRDVCTACRRGKTKCSPRDPRTGKCDNCARLEKKCVTEAGGQTKTSKTGNALTSEAASSAHAPKQRVTSYSVPKIAVTGLAPNHGQSASFHPTALSLVPVLREFVKDALHDSELEKSIEWAGEFFDGAFDVKAFRDHLNEAAQLGPSHPYLVQLCHWALILRRPRINVILEGEDADELVSTTFGILFTEFKEPTLWTLKATIILLDHFRKTEDARCKYLRVLAHKMVDNPSYFNLSDGQGDTIEKLSLILHLRFPRGSSHLNFAATHETQESIVAEQSDEERNLVLRHPIDVFQNAQQAFRGNDHDTPQAERPDELLDSILGMPLSEPSNYLMPPLNTPFLSLDDDIADILRVKIVP